MGKRDERIDAYIAKSADFARPILTHLRELVHTACPEIEESLEMELSEFRLQRNRLQHGVVQTALLVSVSGKRL